MSYKVCVFDFIGSLMSELYSYCVFFIGNIRVE